MKHLLSFLFFDGEHQKQVERVYQKRSVVEIHIIQFHLKTKQIIFAHHTLLSTHKKLQNQVTHKDIKFTQILIQILRLNPHALV